MVKAFLAILHAEIAGRKSLLLAVAVLGILPLTAPLWSNFRFFDVEGARVASAMALSLLVTLGGAVGLGSSMVIGKQAEGRLGFFLARPISGWVLWLGQLTAAVLSLWLSWWLAWIPTMLFGGSPLQFFDRGLFLSRGTSILLVRPWGQPPPFESVPQWISAMPGPLSSRTFWSFAVWAAFCLLLLMLSHWLAMVVRLRTRWALFDLSVLGLVVLMGAQIYGHLRSQMAFRDLTLAAYGMGLTVILAVVWAGGWQVARGGSLAFRSHRTFSLFFWPWPFLALLAVAGYDHWLTSKGPEDLATLVNLQASPDGEWLVVSGKVWPRGSYEPVFAYHPESGRHHKLGARFALPYAPTFAGGGNALVWIECWVIGSTCELSWLSLDGSGRRSSFAVPGNGRSPWNGLPGQRLALSDDGGVLAMVLDGRLEIVAMPEQTLLATQRIDEAYRVDLDLQSEQRLRAFLQYLGGEQARLEVWELDLRDRSWWQRSVLQGYLWAHDKTSGRLLVQNEQGVHRLYDSWGTTDLGALSDSSFRGLRAARFLSTGDLISFEIDGQGQAALRHYGPDGRFHKQFPLQDGESALLGGELERGRLLIGVRHGPGGNSPTGSLASSAGTFGMEIPGFGHLRRWRSQLLDVQEGGWSGDAWPERIPAWQRVETAAQSGLLLSNGGIEGLEPSSAGIRPVSMLRLGGD